uniref:Endoglucanase n=1 Tax=Ciona savignyi TaxID=51511 RepID=H2YMU1_CIOSA
MIPQMAVDYPGTTAYDFNEVLHKSILFYEAQRSGALPQNNRIPWRGDSGLKDGCDQSKDLSGGYYDAGDNVKFGFPMAFTATTLAWGMIEFKDAYLASGELNRALDMLKWATDYFVKAHTAPNEFYAQVGDPAADHAKWERPEDAINTVRRSYKIDQNNAGTEVAAETAAALAAASIVFRSSNPNYADLLVTHARQLFNFANTYRKNYHLSVPGVATYYKSWNGYNDELLWGAVWLYKATNEQTFMDYVVGNYDSFGAGNLAPEFSWDNKYAGVQVLMAQLTGNNKYQDDMNQFVQNAMTGIPKTSDGLTWKIQWGPNRYAGIQPNYAFIATVAGKVDPQSRAQYVTYAKNQIYYMLGTNTRGQKYVIGMGTNSPQRPHHRASSCPAWTSTPVTKCDFSAMNLQGPNPHVLYGALVGGPDISGAYTDDRSDYISNEVATDYNAGFQSAVAGLLHYAAAGQL